MLAEPPRRGTVEQHPADAPFWNAVCGAASTVKSPIRTQVRGFLRSSYSTLSRRFKLYINPTSFSPCCKRGWPPLDRYYNTEATHLFVSTAAISPGRQYQEAIRRRIIVVGAQARIMAT